MPLDPIEIRKQLRESFTAAIAAGQPKKARRLLESFWLFDGFGGSDLWDRFRPRSNDGDGEAWVPPSVPTDRRHGSNWPLWRNQPELDWLRQESRLRAQTNSFAQGMLRNLVNNVIGKGYSYKVHALDDDDQPLAEEQMEEEDKRYVRNVQEIVDNFLKKNHWNCSIDPTDITALAATRERDIFRTVMIDGEAFIRFHGQEDGTMIVRPIDSSQIRDGGKYLPQEGWTYGIQHQMEPFEDVETPLTYAVFWPDAAAKGGEGGSADDFGTWTEIDAEEILHIKGADTPSNIKRGTGLFLYDVGRALDRASKLQNNISAGAAVRSAIAETVQLKQAPPPLIQNMAQALATHSRTDPVTGRQTPVERIPPGTIRRVPEGWELVQPSADYSESYLTGKDGDLQAAAAGAGIASFVLGGLESGNYSNFESASYPPVQNAVCEQEYFKMAFARVVWKAIQWAMKCGVLPADVLGRVTLVVEAPAVLHRNELEKAQEDQISVTMGWKDRQTCASERGLDWKQVEANNADFQKKQNELMPQPMPGQGGKPGGGANGQANGQGPKPPKPKVPQGDRGVRESLLEAGHDVSDEPRDDSGEWTSGGDGGGEEGELKPYKPKSKAAGMRKKSRHGFKSHADRQEKQKRGSRVHVEGHGAGTVDDLGDFFAWVKLDKDDSIVKVSHAQVKPLDESEGDRGVSESLDRQDGPSGLSVHVGPPNVTVNIAPSPAPEIHLAPAASEIHIAPSPAPEIHVAPAPIPEIYVAPSPAPEVKVLVEQAPPPQVNIENHFDVPAPEITINPPDVHVNVEAPPAAQVHVTNEPPVIHNEIEIPPPSSQVETMEVVRDEEGRITKTKKKITPCADGLLESGPPDELRNDQGEWTTGGGGGKGLDAAVKKLNLVAGSDFGDVVSTLARKHGGPDMIMPASDMAAALRDVGLSGKDHDRAMDLAWEHRYLAGKRPPPAQGLPAMQKAIEDAGLEFKKTKDSRTGKVFRISGVNKLTREDVFVFNVHTGFSSGTPESMKKAIINALSPDHAAILLKTMDAKGLMNKDKEAIEFLKKRLDG